MPMGICRECGKFTEVSRRSKLCVDCQLKRMEENIRQLREKDGVYFKKWAERYSRSAEKILGRIPEGVFRKHKEEVKKVEED